MSEALISSEIAEPYAQALMSVAQQNNLTEQFGDNFRQLISLMEESEEFSAFVANPIIKAEDKKNVLRRVLGDSANPYLINFLMLLIDKRRIIFLKQVAEQYLSLLRKLNQTVLAEAIAAKELTDSQKQAVIDRVKAISKAQNVELKTSVDPNLIGGVVIKIGSQVIDASLRGQLRRISMSLNS
ncbi:ATP synthase F1, delta subunit [Stanieria sp. NIES-3757]|nr:ATP synthase F1, delta subunit [Stanieria sp. NIES-3757]